MNRRKFIIQHADGEHIATLDLPAYATNEECDDVCRAYREANVAAECDVTWFEVKK